MKTIRSKSKLSGILKCIWPILCLVVLLGFFVGVSNLSQGSNDESAVQLEKSIKRAALSCYATQGVYPESLDYIKEHYGISVDESKYFVDYVIFGSNIFPDITVVGLE